MTNYNCPIEGCNAVMRGKLGIKQHFERYHNAYHPLSLYKKTRWEEIKWNLQFHVALNAIIKNRNSKEVHKEWKRIGDKMKELNINSWWGC